MRVGSVVRIDLHGRRVRGWVVAEGPGTDRDVALKPIAKVSPGFVDPELVDLSTWAAWRWAGKRRTFLSTATQPSQSVRALRPAGAQSAFGLRTVRRVGPAIDPWPIVEEAATQGPLLLLLPSVARVGRWQRRLRDAGLRDVIVGARAGAWLPCPGLAGVVVIDAHDEAYTEERAPTWNAWVLAAERAARAGAPCVLVTPTPTPEHLAWGELVAGDHAEERRGWARLEIVDRRNADPRTGLWSTRVVDLVRGPGRVLCILNRTGRARLLRCGTCGTVATCERCASAVRQDAAGQLVCDRCTTERPVVCLSCGATKLKALRIGTARAAEELTALAGEAVGEVTGASAEVPDTRVIIGTEALLHRVGRADVVVFVDLDAELSAPHFRANEVALALLARASRIVRGRLAGGRVVVQTRQPDHPVLRKTPEEVVAEDDVLRRALDLPPYVALARLSGDEAPADAERLRGRLDVTVLGPGEDGSYLVRAADHDALCNALSEISASRIAVDPVRV